MFPKNTIAPVSVDIEILMLAPIDHGRLITLILHSRPIDEMTGRIQHNALVRVLHKQYNGSNLAVRTMGGETLGSLVVELLSVASIFGMVAFASSRWAIRMEYAFLWVISVITGLLFAASFTMVYGVVVWGLWGCGLGMLGYTALTSKQTLYHPLFWGPLVILLVFSVMFSTMRLIHYDNYSHWALITKIITVRLRLPIEADLLVTHSAYPMGTALFSSLLTITSGMTDSILIRANLMMYLAAITVFMKLRKTDFWTVGLSVTALSLWAFALRIAPSDLLVDTLLAFVFLAAWVVVLYEEDLKVAGITLLPFLFFLTMMKSTGLLMAMVLSVIFVWRWVRHRQRGRVIPLLILAVPLITQFLIRWSASLRYSNALISKHAFTLEWLSDMMALKSSDQVNTILKALIDQWAQESFVVVILISYGILLLGLKWMRSERWSWVRWGIPLFTYVSYQIGILFMYLYSMPIGEALRLAGYFRYRSTIVIILVFMIFFDLINAFAKPPRSSAGLFRGVLAGFIAIVALVQPVNVTRWLLTDYTQGDVIRFERLIEEEPVNADDRIILYVTADHAQYVTLIARYVFLSPTIKSLTPETFEAFTDWSQVDTLIVFDADEKIHEWLTQCTPSSESLLVVHLNGSFNASCLVP